MRANLAVRERLQRECCRFRTAVDADDERQSKDRNGIASRKVQTMGVAAAYSVEGMRTALAELFRCEVEFLARQRGQARERRGGELILCVSRATSCDRGRGRGPALLHKACGRAFAI